MPRRTSPIAVVLPGILLAATGVGAGDLLTSALAGSEAGLGVLWAVVAGVALKWALSEGVARWQLATGSTVLEGWAWRLGPWIRWVFLVYLLLFTVVVGGALVNACGVAGTGLLQLGDPQTSKVVWGVAHSLAGLALVWFGTFRLFETLMSSFIGVMFVTVMVTAALVAPGWREVAAGFVPAVPPGSADWIVAVLGGVGGTVTILSYGYWIREEGRHGLDDVRICRLDLAAGYTMTALFGVAVVIIGSRVEVEGQGAVYALQLADQLAGELGAPGHWVFLAGFWGAVFSSLLGVWQSIPYMFADFLDLSRGGHTDVRGSREFAGTPAYRAYLIFIAVAPLALLGTPVREIQLVYGVFGALFLPLLALTLLVMNNRRDWVGDGFITPGTVNVILAAGLLFFGWMAAERISAVLSAS